VGKGGLGTHHPTHSVVLKQADKQEESSLPSFTSQVPNLHAMGPVVQMGIAVGSAVEQALQSAGQPVPQPQNVLAMIDTGATGSVIQNGLAAQLGLNPVGIVQISTPSSANVSCLEYAVRLLFPNNVAFETTVIETPLQGQQIRCLIGRDVLSQGVLVYIGYSNPFSLSF